MLKRILILLVLLALAGGLIFAYLQMSKERQREDGMRQPR
jgi:flagellar basal body-associated protein FliL